MLNSDPHFAEIMTHGHQRKTSQKEQAFALSTADRVSKVVYNLAESKFCLLQEQQQQQQNPRRVFLLLSLKHFG